MDSTDLVQILIKTKFNNWNLCTEVIDNLLKKLPIGFKSVFIKFNQKNSTNFGQILVKCGD